ncbi:hypothetical protein GCK72_016623 [Caenorhabditis remanei]|uniref:V-type proton ATPase subunit F n=1 Tax=Caenorhabditis remanei TaxID=31234 RepID=A0A6A5G550_CAERE|nr:hypothetical protein GCK72_016623 [Caenorhabditis remanei]KAF1750077.1 hypothetical protein GCK72_016623 [Caenorhabditis remanei]
MSTEVRGKLVAVIGDQDSVVGFLMGGIGEVNAARQSNFYIVEKHTIDKEIESAFRAFCTRDDIAIILINQHVAERIRQVVDDHAQKPQTSVAVLEIPSKEAPYDPSKDSILNRARGLYNPEDFR